jgi:lipoyl(octanoyl) transferase
MLCSAYQLGRVGYREAYKLQVDLLDRRLNNAIGDSLLLLEHPPTITIGKSGKPENILASQAELMERGIPLFFIDRGGDVTYHGPGQLVGYPIIDLRNRGKDLHQYVYDLEEVIIRTLSDFGINAARDESHRGVWVAGREMAAIGLRVRKWVTMHGFALNVNTDLEPFSLINPCGFADREATSMAKVLCQEVTMAAVTERMLARFSEVFSVEIKLGTDSINREILMKARDTSVGGHGDERKTAILV